MALSTANATPENPPLQVTAAAATATANALAWPTAAASATQYAADIAATWQAAALPNGCPGAVNINPADLDLGYLARCGACFELTPNPAYESDLLVPALGIPVSGLGTPAGATWTPAPTNTPAATVTPGPSPTLSWVDWTDTFDQFGGPFGVAVSVDEYTYITAAMGNPSPAAGSAGVVSGSGTNAIYQTKLHYAFPVPVDIKHVSYDSWGNNTARNYTARFIRYMYADGTSAAYRSDTTQEGAWNRYTREDDHSNVIGLQIDNGVQGSGSSSYIDNVRLVWAWRGVAYSTPMPTNTPVVFPTLTPAPTSASRTGLVVPVGVDLSSCAMPVYRDSSPAAGLSVNTATVAETCITVIPQITWRIGAELDVEQTDLCVRWFAAFEINLLGLVITPDWLLVIPLGWFIRRWLQW